MQGVGLLVVPELEHTRARNIGYGNVRAVVRSQILRLSVGFEQHGQGPGRSGGNGLCQFDQYDAPIPRVRERMIGEREYDIGRIDRYARGLQDGNASAVDVLKRICCHSDLLSVLTPESVTVSGSPESESQPVLCGHACRHGEHLRIGNYGRRRQTAFDLGQTIAQITDCRVYGSDGLSLRLHDRRGLMLLRELSGQRCALGTLGVELVLHLAHLQLTELVVDDLRLGVDFRAEGRELRVGRVGQRVGLVEHRELTFVALPFNGGAHVAAARGHLGEHLRVAGLYGVDDLLRREPRLSLNVAQSRLDLLKENRKVFQSILEPVLDSGFHGIFLVATNPVDIMARIVYEISGFPPGQVVGTGTALDTARLRYLLGEKFIIDPRNMHAYVMGEHGDSEFVPWSQAMMATKPIFDLCSETEGCHFQELLEIEEEVRMAAYKIIEAKRATYYGIGMAMARITKAILGNEYSVLTVSALLQGEYGEHGVFIGIPCVVNRMGVSRIVELTLSAEEKQRLHLSCETLNETYQDLA